MSLVTMCPVCHVLSVLSRYLYIKREKRAKQGGSLPEEVAPNTGVLTNEDADVDDNVEDDDDDDDGLQTSESPPLPPPETPDTKRKLQPELETPRQQPIPVYDAAEEARKRKLDQDAKDRMALKEFESMGRGKAELRRRENAEERRFIQEEIDRDEREEELKRNFDNVFFL